MLNLVARDYRLFEHKQYLKPGKYQVYFDIREVHYDEFGKIFSVSEEPVYLDGDTISDIEGDLKLASRAMSKPVLDYEVLANRLGLELEHYEVF